MKKHNATPRNDLQSLADDAKELISATAGVAEEKVIQARDRLASALEKGKEALESARSNAVERAEAADKAIRENPYPAIGIAFAAGALFVCLLRRRDRE